jgi:serine/threonine protein phosphatase 1
MPIGISAFDIPCLAALPFMPARLIAIGDIHGCHVAFQAILEKIAPEADDTLVTLGDYVDRGPDSRSVIESLIELRKKCNLVSLLGNHDDILLDICQGQEELMADWLNFGGEETLASYRTSRPQLIPLDHVRFLESCTLLYETESHFFTHGSYDPTVPLDRQNPSLLLWGKLRPIPPEPHYSDKTAIVGHTAQRDGRILDLGYLKCIDTCCYGDGFLTAMEVNTGRIWQVDKKGKFKQQ